MAKAEAIKIPMSKVVALLTLAKQRQAELGELLEEMDALLGGRAGIGDAMKAFERAFDELWCLRYAPGEHGRYVWTYTRDKPNIKRLLKLIGLEELTARAARYLADDDPFFVRTRHGFGAFVSAVNRFTAASTPAPAYDLVANCHHDPPCRTDQEHTKRRVFDIRGSHSGPVGDVL